jgi:apolipoprotein N-acyltransferase
MNSGMNRVAKEQNFFWKILLSATLFSLAFICSNYLGFAVIYSFFLLYFIQKKSVFKCSIFKIFCFGFLWGLIAFALHFIWLYELLLTKSQAGKFLSATIFIFCVFYFSTFSGLWFCATKLSFLVLRIFCISFICTTLIFFWFLEKYSFFIFGRAEGYPFLNPILPLAKYKVFLLLYSFIYFNPSHDPELKETKIFYLKPVSRAGELSCSTVGQMIYQKLSALDLCKYSSGETLVVVSPETAFPFALNKHEEMLNFWNNVLPLNSHFLIGSQREENGKFFQTLYYINSRRIMQFYDKTHTVLFTEKIPKKWKKFKFAEQLFLKEKEEFHKGKIFKSFKIAKNLTIIPKICSEVFFKPIEIKDKNNEFIFIFVNDSWFLNYFKQLMENFIRLKQLTLGIPMLYITHLEILKLGFS